MIATWGYLVIIYITNLCKCWEKELEEVTVIFFNFLFVNKSCNSLKRSLGFFFAPFVYDDLPATT